ncbi:cation/H(+) antiporter 14-like [Mercurialis annua]|uniref:cation/H(+) antiporter 14-like n=1 Tax=Mercurialis annua TaxID=3986 RepID=UPI002160B314|nr:cation/H(+) antiporter 14-like [Mercurialis annua]
MENVKGVVVAEGIVSGPFFQENIVCQFMNKIKPMGGIMQGENPLEYSFPVLLAQISVIFLSSRLVYFLLKPLRQSALNSQILAGILLGPSVMWYYFPSFKMLFPSGGRVVLNVLADIGAVLHLFILTLQMDTSIIRQARPTEALLAVTGFMCPLLMGFYTFKSLLKDSMLGDPLIHAIPTILIINSLSSFPVITGVLADLKILNSELGRFAAKVSMINDMSCFFMGQLVGAKQAFHESYDQGLKYVVCFCTLLFSIVYIFRPAIIWVTRCAKYGQPMGDIHFFVILMSVFICSLMSEVLGQQYLFGPLVLGAVLPDGPPLGTEIEHRLHALSRGLLLPIFCGISGLNMNVLSKRKGNSYTLLRILIGVSYMSKFMGIFIPAIICRVHFLEAICLTLILCSKGIIEVAIYGSWKDAKVLDAHSFNILLVSLMIISGFSRPIISYLYDPAKKYRTSSRRTIRGSSYQNQLRVLVCIHSADNVSLILNLLKAFNPTKFSPITVFVLHLTKLTGRASSILLPYDSKMDSNNFKMSDNPSAQIFNAFDRLEKQNQGYFLVQRYTAVAPYKTMHADICTVALDKKTTIVIIPYHKQYNFDGKIGSSSSPIRTINRNVMEMAPCTVGLLIDREQIGGKNRFVLNDYSLYRIGMFFFGGDDDSEALAISGRIASHPDVCLTVVLFKHDSFDYNEADGVFDYWMDNLPSGECRNKIEVKHAKVKNGEETIKEICALEDEIDLAIVGRHQDPNSPISMGLTEWTDGHELGIMGDMLSTSDFRFSVLVVTQQPIMTGVNDELMSINSSKSLHSVASSSNLSREEEWKPIVGYT